MRSPATRECYLRRLRSFFEFIRFEEDSTLERRCNLFIRRCKANSNFAFNNIIRFLQFQKERVENKIISAATLLNHVKTLKLFCEINDVTIQWKRLTRGLPRAKRYADDRAPTLEEIGKIVQYPDRRIKPIVCTMVSSGIRVGAWDYLKWGHISPLEKNGKVVAAKIIVYAADDEEYYGFISLEAYTSLKFWMDYRASCGEKITNDSWIMRNLWGVTKPKEKGVISEPKKLTSLGVKRLIERALWAQGIRERLQIGKKRHEFQCDHGFRKWYRTQCELAGLKVSNVEILLNHSIGISDSYYRVTEAELLEDYLKAATEFLTIDNENRMKSEVIKLREATSRNETALDFGLRKKETEIQTMKQTDEENKDAITALSDRIDELMEEIEYLKNKQAREG
jgi:hypothetical protein